jgi:hypothetical protein
MTINIAKIGRQSVNSGACREFFMAALSPLQGFAAFARVV